MRWFMISAVAAACTRGPDPGEGASPCRRRPRDLRALLGSVRSVRAIHSVRSVLALITLHVPLTVHVLLALLDLPWRARARRQRRHSVRHAVRQRRAGRARAESGVVDDGVAGLRPVCELLLARWPRRATSARRSRSLPRSGSIRGPAITAGTRAGIRVASRAAVRVAGKAEARAARAEATSETILTEPPAQPAALFMRSVACRLGTRSAMPTQIGLHGTRRAGPRRFDPI